MKKLLIITVLVIPQIILSHQLPGLTINSYLKLSGLWNDSNDVIDLRNDSECPSSEFGWGFSKCWPNSYTIIDPVGDLFHFSGLHALTFKSIKEINPNLFDVELFFINGSIHKYRINILNSGKIKIEDNGSIDKYISLNRNYTRINSFDINVNTMYGYVDGTKVRIREFPNIKSKIYDLVPNKDKVLIVRVSESEDTIENEKFKWYKVVTDSGYHGWIWGKYIKYINY